MSKLTLILSANSMMRIEREREVEDPLIAITALLRGSRGRSHQLDHSVQLILSQSLCDLDADQTMCCNVSSEYIITDSQSENEK